MRPSSLALALALAMLAPLAPTSAAPALLPSPTAVVALIDTGVNPYNLAFRDTSPRAFQHPCTYLPGYPCSAEALVLSLDAPTYEAAIQADQAVWDSVRGGTLYWVPGTKVVGWTSLGGGGARCDPPSPPIVLVAPLSTDCRDDRTLLDDHGHGTMTASRATANAHSLCPECLVVEIEGLGPDGVYWASSQPWIDVLSNSWGFLLPQPFPTLTPQQCTAAGAPPPPGCAVNTRGFAFRLAEAAKHHFIFFASGNGLEFSGFAPTPTYFESTYPPGVLLVGGHDNGRAALWSGAPAHVVADAFGGWAADAFSIPRQAPDPIACCTSTAAPYAAGGMAGLVVEARRLVGDTTVGNRGGDVAVGTAPPGVTTGPLRDGRLSFAEARELYLKTAQARPQEGRDDGLVGFLADPRAPGDGDVLPYGVGGNPYCQGCFAVPLRWQDLPADADGAFAAHLGYGAVNEFGLAQARRVMLAQEPMPDRSREDAWFAAEGAARGVFFYGAGS